MNDNSVKQLPSGDLNLVLTSGGGLPTIQMPRVEDPFPGRDGRRLANEMREKYFRLWHNMVLEKLAIASIVVLNDYALQVLDAEINRMLDRYYDTIRRPAANAAIQEVTELCVKNLVAAVRAVLENHPRRLGEIL
jgi:hypothetical protein